MIAFKACPRCRGDLMQDEFLGQAELACLQCGYRRELKPVEPASTAHIAGRAA